MIEHERAEARRPRKGERGTQSRFRAAATLIGLPPPTFRDLPGELIRLKGADKRLIDYRDTAQTERMRLNLRGINDNIASVRISLDAPEAVVDGPVIRLAGQIMHPQRVVLHRVFNGDFKHGGRLYGGWWQGVPKAARPFITIDGEATCELDYPQHHARLLYRVAGLQIPTESGHGFRRQSGQCSDRKPAGIPI